MVLFDAAVYYSERHVFLSSRQSIDFYQGEIFQMFGYCTQLALALLAGLISHWTFFVHGEHDLAAGKIGRLYVLAIVLIPLTKCVLEGLTVWQAVKESVSIDIAYVLALFSSITVFRLFLSPLRRISGPFILRLTKLTHVWDMACFQNCKILDDYHRKYGDVVRTGRSLEQMLCYECLYLLHFFPSKSPGFKKRDILKMAPTEAN